MDIPYVGTQFYLLPEQTVQHIKHTNRQISQKILRCKNQNIEYSLQL
jgi:hypothetical protein